jgi:NADH:ubiquinone oxidoreductase subunit H
VGVLLGVAFFNLIERKVFGYMHIRKCTTKVFYFCEFQPIGDAVKLFGKELYKVYGVVFLFYMGGPLLGLILMIIL